MVYGSAPEYYNGMEPFKDFLPRLPRIPETSLTFASKSEYACGMLLERYVRGFELKNGVNFQVGVGHSKTIDFLVDGVFVEYHPINLKFEFDNPVALRRLLDGIRRVDKHAKREIVDAIKQELAEKYYRRRKFLVTLAAGKDTELICCFSPEDFCKNVIRRFGDATPKVPVLLTQFHNLIQKS